MINSQAKGKKAERDVAKEINRFLGTNVRRTPQSGGMSIKGDKMNAKFYATLELKDWLSSLAEFQELKHSHDIMKEELEDLRSK